jgi:hypothetical protein
VLLRLEQKPPDFFRRRPVVDALDMGNNAFALLLDGIDFHRLGTAYSYFLSRHELDTRERGQYAQVFKKGPDFYPAFDPVNTYNLCQRNKLRHGERAGLTAGP